MNLQQKLEALNLSAEDIKEINSLVDNVIISKTEGLQNQISQLETDNKKLNGDIENVNKELTPYKKEAREKQIRGLLPSNADIKKANAIIKLSDITDEDDDKTIKAKLEEVIKENDFLQAGPSPLSSNSVEVNKEKVKVEDKFPNL